MCQTERFSLWVLQIVGLLALLALCLFLALRPRSPNFTLVDISVPSLNHTNDPGRGTISFELEIQNPNKDSGIYYNGILISFSLGGNEELGTNNKTAFYQKRRDKESYGNDVDVSGGVWRDLRNAIRSGKAELKVDVVTKVKYSTWGIKSKHHGLHKSAKVPIDGSGNKIKLKDVSKKLSRGTSWVH